MKKLELKPFKTCTCGKELKADEVHWIGQIETPKRALSLFNCPHCKSTGCVKIINVTIKEKK